MKLLTQFKPIAKASSMLGMMKHCAKTDACVWPKRLKKSHLTLTWFRH